MYICVHSSNEVRDTERLLRNSLPNLKWEHINFLGDSYDRDSGDVRHDNLRNKFQVL
jgi:hypothetical protein